MFNCRVSYALFFTFTNVPTLPTPILTINLLSKLAFLFAVWGEKKIDSVQLKNHKSIIINTF